MAKDSTGAAPSPENILSDAALASLLQMVQQSLMMSFAPPDVSGFPFSRIPNSGEVKETILGPGTTLRVVHRTFKPPPLQALSAGQKENSFLQKQLYGSEKFSVLNTEFGKKKEESPDVIDLDAPKEALDDLEELKNNIEKLNSVLE